jgi:hypothetical protein
MVRACAFIDNGLEIPMYPDPFLGEVSADPGMLVVLTLL